MIMSTEHEVMLARVFARVAGDLAFMFIEPQEDGFIPSPSGPCVSATIAFSGKFEGSLSIAVPTALCPVIAANVLGVEPEDESATDQLYDALTELLNVTCGNLLTALAGDEPVFDLTIPTVQSLDLRAWDELQRTPGTVGLVLEEHPVLLRLSL